MFITKTRGGNGISTIQSLRPNIVRASLANSSAHRSFGFPLFVRRAALFSSVAFHKRWIIYCPFDFKRFVGYNEIEPYLTGLGARVIGCTKEQRKILSLRIGDGPVCVLEAGIHAREWASPMAALYAVDKLINEPIPGLTWIIVPLLNPDGYEYSRKSMATRFWRKNMNNTKSRWCQGVDINRNFGIHWGDPAGCAKNPCMDTYCGLGPWSEVESISMKSHLAEERDIRAYISLHACLQAIMYPPTHSTQKAIDIEDLESVAKEISSSIMRKYGREYNVGQSSVIDKIASGSSIDWARQELGVKYSYNIALPGPDMGYLLPENEIENVGKELHEAMMAVSLVAKNFGNTEKPEFVEAHKDI